MTQHYVIGAPNLQKAVSIAQLPDSAWTWYTPHVSETDENTQQRYQAVPWLNRGVTLRAQAVASLPFALYQGDNEYDISDEWANKVEFLPNPQLLLWLVEAALTMLGQAYLFKVQGTRSGKVKELKYMVPSSIEPVIKDDAGLVGFIRHLGAKTLPLTPEQLCHFWLPDLYTELGPPSSCPAKAAMQAAGVLYNVDQFASSFFERGAIKATLLTVENMPPPDEKTKLKKWWERVISGLSNAWSTEVISASVEPKQIGEGIQELSDAELTKEKREDISTALGIPQTLLFSQAANYATAQEDRLSFYRETIVPEANFIASVLNDQLLTPLSLRWEFQPETLDVFQTDETARSQAFMQYVQAGMPLGMTAEMLGLELPPGYEYSDLDAEKEERRQFAAQQFGGGRQQEQEEPELPPGAKSDLKRWRTVALKAIRAGNDPNEREFRSDTIPDDIQQHIRAMLDGATTDEEVKAAFAAPFPEAAPADYTRWAWADAYP